MCKIGNSIRQYLARAASSLALTLSLAAISVALPSQKAPAEVVCSPDSHLPLCRSIIQECSANPQLCEAESLRRTATSPVTKQDVSRASMGQTIALDPPSAPLPAQPAELDVAAQTFLAGLHDSAWQFTGDIFAMGPFGRTSPSRAEFSVALTSVESMLYGAAAGEITFRIYTSEADANRFYDAALHGIDTDAISRWNIAVEGSSSPVECLAAVQAANLRDWVPFELKRTTLAALMKSPGTHDWARCYARRGARVVIATIVLPHKNDNPIPLAGPSPTTLQAAANTAFEAATGKGQAQVTNGANK